jgi:hypothetical protein
MSDTATAASSWTPTRYGGVASLREALVSRYRQRRRRNPELAKALAFVHRYFAEARNLLELDDDQAPLRTAKVTERFRQLLSRELEKLSIDEAWELANDLKRELLLIADGSYVWAQLAYEVERDKKPNKWHRWSEHFPAQKLRGLIEAQKERCRDRKVDASVHLEAVRSLTKLYDLRAEEGLERRARAAQKCRYLTALIPILLVPLATLSASMHEAGADTWRHIALAASAGALGATLSGTFRVRDQLVELDDLRSFWPAMRIQPLIGATAGLVTLFVLEAGALNVEVDAAASWGAVALFTFAAGFSEPFFLGLVERVAVIPDKQTRP